MLTLIIVFIVEVLVLPHFHEGYSLLGLRSTISHQVATRRFCKVNILLVY